MIAKIVRDGCILCGLCASTCPEVFQMGVDGPRLC
ncbi:ferredoxin [Pectinatus brassicae]